MKRRVLRGALTFCLVAVVGGLATLTAIWRSKESPISDDGFILMVYARHLAESGQIYWNLHDGHLDGATSFLDLVIKSAALRFIPVDPIWISWAITFLFLLGVPLLALASLRRAGGPGVGQRPRWLPAVAVAVAMASNVPLAFGATFMLETPMFAFLGCWALFRVVWRRNLSFAWIAITLLLWIALALSRPEGIGLVLLVGALLLRAEWTGPHRQALIRALLVFGAAMAVYFTWHISYFGHWAPNTYYAKQSTSRLNEIEDGLAYLWSFACSPVGVLLLVGLLASPIVWRWADWTDARVRWGFGVAVAMAGASIILVVLAGGDCYPGGRFMALPAMLGLAALGLALLGLRGVAHGGAWALTGAIVLIQGWSLGSAYLSPSNNLSGYLSTGHWPPNTDMFWCEADALDKIKAAVPSGKIAETDFQRAKYWLDDTDVIDLHGLNDGAIAHIPREGHVLWGKFAVSDGIERDAEIWFLGHHPADHVPMANVPIRELLYNPAYAERYIGYTLQSSYEAESIIASYVPASIPTCDRYINFFLRKDVAAGPRLLRTQLLVGPSEEPRRTTVGLRSASR